MAVYPPNGPISGIDQNLFPFDVIKDVYEEWMKITPLSNLMGSKMDSVIYRHKMKDGDGLQFRVGRLNALDYKNPVVGLAPRREAAQMQSTTWDAVTAEFKSFPIRLEGRDIVRLGTPIQLPKHVREQLVTVNKRNLNWDLFNEMTINNYPLATMNTFGPSYDRIIMSNYNVAGANYPSRATYNTFYSNAQQNGLYDALGTIPAIGNGPQPANGSVLSGLMLLAAKRMGEFGGPPTDSIEAAIQPAYMLSQNGWPMNDYIALIDPDNLPNLMKDPIFMETTMARGTSISKDQPQAIHGADYIGKFLGTHIYTCSDLMQYRITPTVGNAVGSTFTWNLFLGGGAMAIGWHEFPFIVEQFDAIDRIQYFVTHEQRGQKALKFASKINPNVSIEQGIIHMFSRLT